MSLHKNFDKICMVIIAVTLVISFIFCNGSAIGIEQTAHAIGYENRIFDDSKVHKIDIVINDWDGFLETCENEQYSQCNVVIDGEAVKNVGIRAKGNTSLSTVKSMDSDRYSFKIEFDQYNSGQSYHGLDKLCLNNIIQDNTYMKDYLSYTLMKNFGVNTPLCSYVYITVNGEDWGLYLAVEGVEDSFLQRNYGSDYGELYKPDSMNFANGGESGMDFSMGDFMNRDGNEVENSGDNSMPTPPNDFNGGGMPDFSNFDFSDFDSSAMTENGEMPDFSNMEGFGGFGGMGGDDVKLKYTDDDFDSYSNIFNSAKTDINYADKKRLINSLKELSEESNIDETVDVEEVIRYFVVHNFLCNGDSYTGMMVHNYYLYEKDGQLSMIPWDYNLAFGTFQGSDASSSVNSPIDTPVSGDMSDRPMISWIFDNEEYTEQYHQLFSEFINQTDFETLVNETASMIAEYVEKDPTKFCTYEEFEKGVSAIRDFCLLRKESIQGQLNGTIPSTSEGQNADKSALIDTSSLSISDMGTMGSGGGFGTPPNMNFGDFNNADVKNTSNFSTQLQNNIPPDDFNGEIPEDFDPSNIPDGSTPPDMTDTENQNNSSDGNGDSTSPNGNKMPMGDFPAMNTQQSSNGNSLILLGISVIVLIVGIFVAVKFKR